MSMQAYTDLRGMGLILNLRYPQPARGSAVPVGE